ncbi:GtrA family protein [Trujillonella endophytica]|uniref:Putative flippase GtrA (Transmembrane translocase of bactoprenol-linked glucose) n=1 Tax=Trujillonella endophytica TaxID=673521 RepID=A0A1H8UHS2_9ACTN|nr:GtrA family protein [Trujillella endophytica]SEP02735.1 Putative flippase GtrA (transmembrane translocase of bactoprenol-linked glucose) [Trujillella endophytica]
MSCSTLSRPRGEWVEGVLARARADDGIGQFTRFVLVGGSTSALYALLFVALHGMGEQPANWIGSVITSVLANEMHRRLTFRAGERVSFLTAQVEGGALSIAGLVSTSLALAWLTAATSTDDPYIQFGLVALVTATIGTLRFIALRWLFRPRADALP